MSSLNACFIPRCPARCEAFHFQGCDRAGIVFFDCFQRAILLGPLLEVCPAGTTCVGANQVTPGSTITYTVTFQTTGGQTLPCGPFVNSLAPDSRGECPDVAQIVRKGVFLAAGTLSNELAIALGLATLVKRINNRVNCPITEPLNPLLFNKFIPEAAVAGPGLTGTIVFGRFPNESFEFIPFECPETFSGDDQVTFAIENFTIPLTFAGPLRLGIELEFALFRSEICDIELGTTRIASLGYAACPPSALLAPPAVPVLPPQQVLTPQFSVCPTQAVAAGFPAGPVLTTPSGFPVGPGQPLVTA